MLEVQKHFFIGGTYLKQIRLPDNCVVIQHKHQFTHATLLATGCVVLESDEGQSTHYAPDVIEIKAGISHSFQAVNGDVVLYCIHATDVTDPELIDSTLIAGEAHA
jgi:quercetin dioxygenase-like cupin family protein